MVVVVDGDGSVLQLVSGGSFCLCGWVAQLVGYIMGGVSIVCALCSEKEEEEGGCGSSRSHGSVSLSLSSPGWPPLCCLLASRPGWGGGACYTAEREREREAASPGPSIRIS